MSKQEIFNKLEEMGIVQYADARRGRVTVPPHRIIDAGIEWNPVADELEKFGFSGRGRLFMEMEYSENES